VELLNAETTTMVADQNHAHTGGSCDQTRRTCHRATFLSQVWMVLDDFVCTICLNYHDSTRRLIRPPTLTVLYNKRNYCIQVHVYDGVFVCLRNCAPFHWSNCNAYSKLGVSGSCQLYFKF